jgi:hypothetical protein
LRLITTLNYKAAEREKERDKAIRKAKRRR